MSLTAWYSTLNGLIKFDSYVHFHQDCIHFHSCIHFYSYLPFHYSVKDQEKNYFKSQEKVRKFQILSKVRKKNPLADVFDEEGLITSEE